MPWKLKKTLLSQGFKPWSFPLVGFVLLVFLGLSLPYWEHAEFTNLLTANREQVLAGHEYFRLFTTIAIHGDLKHFLSNALFFYVFAYLLHSYFGLLWFPFSSLFFGALTNFFTLSLYPEHSVLIGASGVVYFMAGAWATLFFLIERHWKIIKRAMATIGVCLILLFPTEFQPEVSYLAHSIGFFTGLLVAVIYFALFKKRIRDREVWNYIDDEVPEVALVKELTSAAPH